MEMPAEAGLAATVAALAARAEISEILTQYCEALDQRDLDLLRDCFHPGSTHDHGGFVGPSAEFCEHAMALLARLVATQHHLGTVSIKVDAETAEARAYFTAYHRLPGEGEMVFPQANPNDDVFIAGRYLDRFERRGGRWRIVHRTGKLDWWRFEPAADRERFGGLGGTGLPSGPGAGLR
jgi:hypothetical protein